MKSKLMSETNQSLHQELIDNEISYQRALKNDEQFSVLKGFKDILKALRSRLDKKPL
jgi:hypothetical protein